MTRARLSIISNGIRIIPIICRPRDDHQTPPICEISVRCALSTPPIALAVRPKMRRKRG